MKYAFKPTYLPWITLTSGAIGFALRVWLLRSVSGSTQLLPAGHIASTLCWVLTAVVLGLLLLCCLPLRNNIYIPRHNLAGSVGCLLAAVGVAFYAVSRLLSDPDILTLITALLGLLSAGCLLSICQCRFAGKTPHFLLHGAICLFFVLQLISQYRHWSADPQLDHYGFQLLATVCLMLTAYYQAALDLQVDVRRWRTFFGLAALYFCCLAAANGVDLPFYIGAAAWMLTAPGLLFYQHVREDA